MAVAGLIDARISTGDRDRAHQEAFKILWNFFEFSAAQGYCTRIALQWGVVTAVGGGDGTGWWDEALAFGPNAFAVYQYADFTVLIQYGDYSYSRFGVGVGAPGRLRGQTNVESVGVALAAREDGTTPWGGTTNNDGTDTKGTPVWTPGASTLHVVDRSNSPYTPAGSFNTNKENCIQLTPALSNQGNRIHCVGNADSFVFFIDGGNRNYYPFFGGKYVLRPGLSSLIDLPLVAMQYYSNSGFPNNGSGNLYGDTQNGNTTYQGGLLARAGDGVGPFYWSWGFGGVQADGYQPNQQSDDPELDASAVYLTCAHRDRRGWVGTFDPEVLSIVRYVSNNSCNGDGTRAYFSIGTNVTAERWSIPWDGGQAPGNSYSRNGRTFTA